ncbi:putative phosphoesterase [Helianthus annuus]|nr:putative phosphoesterase [Helianthus annuus]KAJ0641833.1 putative phosphoesterase [Helianthus annuus]KAJ0645708.1 putative phosphoesterase [Helianthus annuus]
MRSLFLDISTFIGQELKIISDIYSCMSMQIVALPEPEKMRHSDANEEANITDFQEELVQLGAVLKGDHKESDYPDKLVENMKVNEAAEYCQVAFKKFCDDCEKAKSEGKDESYIVCDGEVSSGRKTSKTFADKLFSCLVCDN